VERAGGAALTVQGEKRVLATGTTRRDGVRQMLETLWSGDAPPLTRPGDITMAGHRVVHGGSEFREPVRITAEVKAAIERLSPLAPEHNPASLEGIEALESLLGPDTGRSRSSTRRFTRRFRMRRRSIPGRTGGWKKAFGALVFTVSITPGVGSAPRACFPFAIPRLCAWSPVIWGTAARSPPFRGAGVSTRPWVYADGGPDDGQPVGVGRSRYPAPPAVGDGRAVGRRAGRILNEESGLKGLSGISEDLRAIIPAIEAGDKRARLAVDVYIHRLRAQIGAMIAGLGGLDALVFTAGVGENSTAIRAGACEPFAYLGLRLDDAANREPSGVERDIAQTDSAVRALVIPAHEDWAVARECLRLDKSLSPDAL
jgi:acetate kinase